MTNDEQKPGGTQRMRGKRFGVAERDILALGIATAAIILFVGTGGLVFPQAIRAIAGLGLGPDKALTSALLLNVALIIFGWRRYRQLSAEVHDRRKAEEQAKLLAEIDPLTGCLNRRSVGEATARLVAAASGRGEVVALVMIDLDNFKQINDFNGHNTGDQVLRECAARIAALMPPRALLARLGGDEFACILPFDPRRPEAIDDLAAALIEAISTRSNVSGSGIEITASLGLTRSDFPRSEDDAASWSTRAAVPDDAQTLLHMADIAMYHAKRAGRNRYFWFDAPMQNELRFRREIEQGIRRGIRLGEFVPYYEQQIDLASGELTGFEMLARWNSPTLGMISPEIFIPIAEEIGAIADLSESVIAQALEDARGWDARLTLSVNISPLQMRDPWFAQKMLKMLVEANFPAHRLEIEITESCLHENVSEVRTLVSSLKNQGIRISLDDFGTGYSSLAQLRSLPFDRIKIDRMFVTNLTDDSDSAAIVDAVTRLGRDLGLPVTAEGIESQEILDCLMQYGDIKGQGFLYGQPQPASVTRARLASLDLLRIEGAPDVVAESMPEKREAARKG